MNRRSTSPQAPQPRFGTASVTTGGISYKPAQDFNGTDSFEYRACDDGTPTKCATAHVLVSVTPVNDAPSVTLDPVKAAPEGSTVNLAAHGHDVDGDPLTFTWNADGGTLASIGDTATLEVGNGPAAIAVTVTVGDGAVTREAHLTVTVYDVAPDVDAGENESGIEGTAVALAASFADPGTGGTPRRSTGATAP